MLCAARLKMLRIGGPKSATGLHSHLLRRMLSISAAKSGSNSIFEPSEKRGRCEYEFGYPVDPNGPGPKYKAAEYPQIFTIPPTGKRILTAIFWTAASVLMLSTIVCQIWQDKCRKVPLLRNLLHYNLYRFDMDSTPIPPGTILNKHFPLEEANAGKVNKNAAVQESASHNGSGSLLELPPRGDLPTYRLDEVKKHGRDAERVWVTYQQGIYDVTDFISLHPGGDKILLAAGGPVEPFWSIYAQHKTPEVVEILEELRIGSLHPDDSAKMQLENAVKVGDDTSDPYAHDPARHPALVVNSQRPFNAETPASLLLDSFQTPNELFFVRNHMPVPDCDERTHVVEVEGIGVRKGKEGPISLTVEELKTCYEPCSVSSVVQCAGNRRKEMHEFKKVQGLMWTGTAISNATWKGCRLRDVLLMAGVDSADKRIKHVHFEGADMDPATGAHYGASIPFEKAMSGEVLIAYEMNGEPIPRDHGYPLRLVVPGVVGARQVKWLTKIRTSEEESPTHWQRRDYRVFPPSVQLGDPLDWEQVSSIQEYPVQSAICSPAPNSRVRRQQHGGTIEVSGYAWSGGGRGIARVEVSADGGMTWQAARLEHHPDQPTSKMWAWTLWRAEVTIPDNLAANGSTVELVCKATDISHNTQPETPVGIWNVRGLLNTAWHRVPIVIQDG